LLFMTPPKAGFLFFDPLRNKKIRHELMPDLYC
jgi:hypothetical protein